MPRTAATVLADDVYCALTDKGMPPMPRQQRDALKAGLALVALAVDALERIADALEAHKPTRPSDDAHNAL